MTPRSGYASSHRAARRRWQVDVARDKVACATCRQPIGRHDMWRLERGDDDGGGYVPAHARVLATSHPGGAKVQEAVGLTAPVSFPPPILKRLAEGRPSRSAGGVRGD